jgi:hypothetical protein
LKLFIAPPISIVLTVQPSKSRIKELGDKGDVGDKNLEEILSEAKL